MLLSFEVSSNGRFLIVVHATLWNLWHSLPRIAAVNVILQVIIFNKDAAKSSFYKNYFTTNGNIFRFQKKNVWKTNLSASYFGIFARKHISEIYNTVRWRIVLTFADPVGDSLPLTTLPLIQSKISLFFSKSFIKTTIIQWLKTFVWMQKIRKAELKNLTSCWNLNAKKLTFSSYQLICGSSQC